MSNVVSPRGPLPPRIYWRRRLLLLVVVVGVVVLVGQLLGGGDDTAAVAERGRAAPAPAGPAAKEPSAAAPKLTAPPRQAEDRQAVKRRQDRQPARGGGVAQSGASLRGAAGPLAQPVGPCQPSAVSIVPDVEDTTAAAPVPLRLGLSTSGAQPCTFEFGPDSVALRVTSGDDLIWESLKCPSAIEEQSVVVRPGWLSYVEVDWSGRRASEGCAQTGDFAAPGYYWAEAAALGGEPERSQFQLEEPPEPKPEPKPKAKNKAQAEQDQQRDEKRDEKRNEQAQREDPETSEQGAGEASAEQGEKPDQRQGQPTG